MNLRRTTHCGTTSSGQRPSRRLSALLLAVFMIVMTAGTSSLAHAQSYAAGYSKYANGDFAGAEQSLQSALAKKPSIAEQAKIQKLLGLCQYTRGDKTHAAASFQAALRANPKITVSADEALDTSVLQFFEAQRSAGTKPAAAAPATTGRPGHEISAARPTAKGGKKTTTLIVDCSIKDAAVAIDGIMAGSVGNPIETDPGALKLEISAPGYVTKSVSTKVKGLAENRIKVELQKPAPKAPPKKAVVAAAAPAAGAATPAGQAKLPALKKQKGADNMFAAEESKSAKLQSGAQGRDLASEFQMDAATGGATAGMQARTAPAPGQAMAAAPQQQQPMMMQQPMQQPMMQQPMMQQPMMQPMQQPMYMPQPMYYPNYPMPAYQQPYGYPPQQMPMAAPVVSTPPPPLAAEPVPSAGGPPPPPSAEPTAKAKPTGPVDNRSMFIAILPFGAGQFQNNHFALGLAFAAGEAGALFYWYQNNSAYNAYVKQANAEILSLQAQGKEQEATAYANDAKAYGANLQKKAQYGLFGFAGLWAVGAIQAIVEEPAAAAPKATKKSRRPKRHALLIDASDWIALDDAPRSSIPGADAPESAKLLWNWHAGLGLMPTLDGTPRANIMAGVEWAF